MFVDTDPAAGECRSEPGASELEHTSAKADGIIACHHALVLERKYQIEVLAFARQKGRTGFGGCHGKAPVELGDINRAQEVVCLLDAFDASDSQLLRKPALPGAKPSFAAAACLRRIGRDQLDSQLS